MQRKVSKSSVRIFLLLYTESDDLFSAIKISISAFLPALNPFSPNPSRENAPCMFVLVRLAATTHASLQSYIAYGLAILVAIFSSFFFLEVILRDGFKCDSGGTTLSSLDKWLVEDNSLDAILASSLSISLTTTLLWLFTMSPISRANLLFTFLAISSSP